MQEPNELSQVAVENTVDAVEDAHAEHPASHAPAPQRGFRLSLTAWALPANCPSPSCTSSSMGAESVLFDTQVGEDPN
jgi:hypothetical protein